MGIGLELFALSFLRADPAQLRNGLRLDAWMALALAGGCAVLLWIMWKYLQAAEELDKQK